MIFSIFVRVAESIRREPSGRNVIGASSAATIFTGIGFVSREGSNLFTKVVKVALVVVPITISTRTG